jgi:acyl carrier protein
MTGKQAEIFQAVRTHLEGRGIDENQITPQATLLGDLDLDSLDTMELTLQMEERFGIEIPDENLESLETVQDAIELIEQRTSARHE